VGGFIEAVNSSGSSISFNPDTVGLVGRGGASRDACFFLAQAGARANAGPPIHTTDQRSVWRFEQIESGRWPAFFKIKCRRREEFSPLSVPMPQWR